ncbi:MAG: AAA family ATPase [Eubacterium sp.]|jgi:ATP-dependent Lon protease
MKTFSQILAENNMKYTGLLDDDAVRELESFWLSLVEENGGTVSDADIDEALDMYQTLGAIAKADTVDTEKNQASGDASGKSENASGRFEDASGRFENTSGAVSGQDSRTPSYSIYYSSSRRLGDSDPILVIDDPHHTMNYHETGSFTNPERMDAFEFTHGSLQQRNIIAADSRFIKLLRWLGKGHICVRLSGHAVPEGYAVYSIKAVDPAGDESLSSASNGFLQMVIRRLLASDPVAVKDGSEADDDTDGENFEDDSAIILTDMSKIIDFMSTAGDTLPPNIRAWAHRNIAMVNAPNISADEKRHAQRALSIVLNIQWQSTWFPSIDPYEARRILDEELYGMDHVKQRVIETIIQINRTHTLPGYGLLLVGPAGTGKSQIAYAIARILKLPWFSLDMSTIHDAEALTGSPRVYTNAKPGRIMEAFSYAGSSNLVFIINELDKADSGASSSNPADTLLALLDGLGFTDNYIECAIPTQGVYPIATANDKSRISDPLISRFAVIDIPDYNADERKIIFRDYVMPKVTKRLGMKEGECVITDEGIDVIIEKYADLPGVRSLEQAGEHIAANALYRIETEHIASAVYGRKEILDLLEQ